MTGTAILRKGEVLGASTGRHLAGSVVLSFLSRSPCLVLPFVMPVVRPAPGSNKQFGSGSSDEEHAWSSPGNNEHLNFNIPVSISDWMPVYFISSTLLNKFNQCKLNEFYGNQDQKWELIYKATKDGFSSKDFHRHCDNKGGTITVVQAGTNAGGNLFGGFTSQSWSSPPEAISGKRSVTTSKYCYDQLAFLFTLVNADRVHPRKFLIKEEAADHATVHCFDCGPCFGAKGDSSVYYSSQSDIMIQSQQSLPVAFPRSYNDDTNVGRDIFLRGTNAHVNELEVYRCLRYTTK